METQEQHLHIPPNWDGKSPIVIVNREGAALQEVQLKKVVEETNIYGPGNYIKKHYKDYLPADDKTPAAIIPKDQLPAILSFIRDFVDRKFSININTHPHHPIDGANITGKLKVNEELTGWRLNEGMFMTPADAIKFIRQRAHHFGDLKAATEMIGLFRNFEVRFETVRKKADDTRGKIEDMLSDEIKFVTGEIPKNITITLPLFCGCPARTLSLEIELQRRGNEASLAFYCMELETMIRQDAESIMVEQVRPFKDLFVCFEKQ